jgi:hypothetical protein
MFVLQKDKCQDWKRRSIDSQGYPTGETQRQNLEKEILEGLLAKGGLALCCQRQGAL